MKLYISSDIEGVAGIAAWDESDQAKGGRWYDYFREQMTREVAAVCEGALAAGATDILVNDAHDTARNILPTGLPKGVRISRGWRGDPYSMVSGLETGFDAVAFTGYHSPASGAGNPLAHTMVGDVAEMHINGQLASEFHIHAYAAGLLGVPVVFLSGDAALCRAAEEFLPGITTVATSEGEGDASTSLHPLVAADLMRAGMEKALKGNLSACRVSLPEWFEVKLRYHQPVLTSRRAFYPGVRRLDASTLLFESEDYYEILRFFLFAL